MFGEWIVKEDTSLDRQAIASIVFQEPEMLQKLDDIVHPAVYQYIVREIERSKKEGTEFFFIEAAMLLEEKYDEFVMRCGIFIAKKKSAWRDSAVTGGIQMKKSRA